MNKEIGDRIKAIRLSKKLYPKDVSAEIGMLQTSYSKIERGGNTSVSTILKIAKVLGVSPAQFFEDTDHVADPAEKIGFVVKADFENLKRVVELLVQRFDERFPPKTGKSYKRSGRSSGKKAG